MKKDKIVLIEDEVTLEFNPDWLSSKCREISETDNDALYENLETADNDTIWDIVNNALADVVSSGIESDDNELNVSIEQLRKIQEITKGYPELKTGITQDVILCEDGQFEIYIDNDIYSNYIDIDELETIVRAYIRGKEAA